MPKNFYDIFNEDPATDQEYRDMTFGLNMACIAALVVLIFSILIV